MTHDLTMKQSLTQHLGKVDHISVLWVKDGAPGFISAIPYLHSAHTTSQLLGLIQVYLG